MKLLNCFAGGNIAASWAAIKSLGEEGYIRKAKELMDVTTKIKDKIKEIPVSTVLPVKSDSDVVFCLQLLSKILTCTIYLS